MSVEPVESLVNYPSLKDGAWAFSLIASNLIPSRAGNEAPLLSRRLQRAVELVDCNSIGRKLMLSLCQTMRIGPPKYLKVCNSSPLQGAGSPCPVR
jgi:hypothetical protein